MLLIIATPLFVIMDTFLNLWLGGEQVTCDMVLFCKWVVVVALINILEQPITQAVRATGSIKKYQVYVGLITLSFLPLCIVMFILGAPAYYSMILLSVVYLVALFIRIIIVSPIIQIQPLDYFNSVIRPLVIVSIIIILVLYLCSKMSFINEIHWVVKFVYSFILAVTVSLFVGLTKGERVMLWTFICNKIFHK